MTPVQTAADRAYELGYTKHSSCDCCEHAAKRVMGFREEIEDAIELIKGDFAVEAALELERVLACLNEWCDDPKATET